MSKLLGVPIKQNVVLIIVALIAAALLSACWGGGEEPTPTPQSPEVDTSIIAVSDPQVEDTSADVAPQAQGMSNSAVADDYRISLLKTEEGNAAAHDLMDSRRQESVISVDMLPGQREGWRLFEAQFAIENLLSFARQAPDLCALLTDSGGYTRIEPVPDSCRGGCGPRYDVSGSGFDLEAGLLAAGGVRYNGLRVFMELPITMSPVTMTLFTPASAGDCASQNMQTVWGTYDFTLPPVPVVFPFDALPDGIPDVADGDSSIYYGDVSISIDNIRFEPNQWAQDSFVLTADATYTNNGGVDVDTNQYHVYSLTVDESGKNLGKNEVYAGMVPPGVPKTYQVPFGYVDKAEYAGRWFYVVFMDAGGNTIGQAQVQMPADIVWTK